MQNIENIIDKIKESEDFFDKEFDKMPLEIKSILAVGMQYGYNIAKSESLSIEDYDTIKKYFDYLSKIKKECETFDKY